MNFITLCKQVLSVESYLQVVSNLRQDKKDENYS